MDTVSSRVRVAIKNSKGVTSEDLGRKGQDSLLEKGAMLRFEGKPRRAIALTRPLLCELAISARF